MIKDITKFYKEENMHQTFYDEIEDSIPERTKELLKINELLKQEIDNRKHIESKLRETGMRFRLLVDNMNEGVIAYDEDCMITYVNDRCCELLCYSKSELIGNPVLFLVDEKANNPTAVKCFTGQIKKDYDDYELILIKKDGERLHTITSSKFVADKKGAFKINFAVITDVSELKQMEDALKESEDMARTLLNATCSAAFLIYPDGLILSVNDTAIKMLGQKRRNVVGKSLFDFCTPEIARLRKIKRDEVIKTKKAVRFKDGCEGKIYDISFYPLFDANSNVERLAVYIRDVTDISNAQQHIHILTQELIKAQENERQRIARDLHDHIAQDLSTLRIVCETLFDDQPVVHPEIKQKVVRLSRILQGTIAAVRNLSYGLHPPGLEQMGLVKTVFQYCQDFSKINGITIDFYSAGVDELKLDFDIEINLYRLIQEALNNIKRHANAKHILIRLVASFPNVILRIEDDGVGFDIEKRLIEALKERRMGLHSMDERVNLLKGKMRIISKANEGTKILVEVPYKESIVCSGFCM